MKLLLCSVMLGAVALAAPAQPSLSPNDVNYNVTLPLQGRAAGPDNWVRIHMWGPKQHVGQFHGQKIWDEVNYAAFRSCGKHFPTDECRDMKTGYKPKGVEYNAKGSLATNAHLTIKIELARWPFEMVTDFEKTRNALADGVAYAYKAMTDQMENCKIWTNPKDKSTRKWCQVGKWVEISFKSGPATGYMRASVTFNGKSTDDRYDCFERPKQIDQIQSYAWSNVIPALKLGIQGLVFNAVDTRCVYNSGAMPKFD